MLDHAKFDQLRDILGDGVDGIGEVVDTFLEETPDAIEELKTGLAEQEAGTVASAAHKIKGSASTLGAMVLSELCGELEDQANQGELDAVAEHVDELEEIWKATRVALQDATAGP